MKTYTQPDFAEACERSGIYIQPRCKDRQYVLPTTDWVKGAFTQAYRAQLEQLGFDQLTMLQWEEDASDCDDFASFARGLARMCHIKSRLLYPTIPKAGIAFAVVDIEMWTPTRGHEINGYFTLESGLVTLKIWEPQKQIHINLTDEQKANVYDIEQ